MSFPSFLFIDPSTYTYFAGETDVMTPVWLGLGVMVGSGPKIRDLADYTSHIDKG